MTRTATQPATTTLDLGSIAYAPAYQRQLELVEHVRIARESGAPIGGFLLLLEHDPPVITISKRPGAARHLLASSDMLARQGVEIHETDRGGDITYHGPGQLVAYPIIDLNVWGLNLHAYMRLLEQAAIDTCAGFGVRGVRDREATGVWVEHPSSASAKICAIGVRIRRWISFHGLALNVNPNLEHFKLIVPCGIQGRVVTSLKCELENGAPPMGRAKEALAEALARRLAEHASATRD